MTLSRSTLTYHRLDAPLLPFVTIEAPEDHIWTKVHFHPSLSYVIISDFFNLRNVLLIFKRRSFFPI